MVIVQEVWHLRSGYDGRAQDVMQELDDLVGPAAHEHPGWCGHARFLQSTGPSGEVVMLYPWRSRVLHEELAAREEPLLAEFNRNYCAAPREIRYFAELAVDVEHEHHDAEQVSDPVRTRTLAGRVALVTGASRGIGRAIALALAADGADVAVNVRAAETAAADAVAQIRALGRRAESFQADVTEAAAAEPLVASVIERMGRLDILVNNVGDFHFKPLDAMEPTEWERILNSNLSSVFYLTRAALPAMRAGGFGRIVNLGLSPVEIVRGAPNIAAYAVAKTGVLVLTRSLAAEQAPYGITVNTVSPGLIDNGHLPPTQKVWMEKRVPMGRLGRSEEVAAAVAFLVSPPASYISGANLAVGGGWDWDNRPVDHDHDVRKLFGAGGGA